MKRAKYDPGPVVSQYAAVLCDEIAGQWCMREAEQQAAANLAPALQAKVLTRCPTHGLLQHYGEIFAVPEDELTRRYEPLVTRRRWKALTEQEGRSGPKILPRHFTTQYFGWQCMAIASCGDDRGIYFATTDEIWKMDNEYDENSWRKIADIPRELYGKSSVRGLSGMSVRCSLREHALYLTTTSPQPRLLRYNLASQINNNDSWTWWQLLCFSFGYDRDDDDVMSGTIGSKITFHEEDNMMIVSSLNRDHDGPNTLRITVIDMPLVRGYLRTYALHIGCSQLYWFHSRAWIVTQRRGGDFMVIHVSYLLSHRNDAVLPSFSFAVVPFEGRFTLTTFDESPTDQYMVTDDGKFILNSFNTAHLHAFQLDPVARRCQHIKGIPGISSMEYPSIGMSYSTDPKQTLILLTNGTGGSLTLFDTETLEYVGSFYCDVHRSLGERDGSGAYVHRKRTLQWRKGEGFDTSIHGGSGPPRKDAGSGDLTLNVLPLTYGNFAHVLFDRNRLILYGCNHYYMYTLTLGPPDNNKKK
jgi:hypothetical protein